MNITSKAIDFLPEAKYVVTARVWVRKMDDEPRIVTV